jgi:exosortase/archaeosortase family protein
MNRHVVMVIVRLALTFGVTVLAFSLLLDPWRNWEAEVLARSFEAVGATGASRAFGYQILVIPDASQPFLATISPSCSALAALLAFAAISLFLVTGDPGRRLLAFLAAAAIVLACNFVRIGMSIWVGLQTDVKGLTVFHDWVGTAFGLLYVLGGFTVYLWVLLPSNRTLLREYERAGAGFTPKPPDEQGEA